MKVSWLFEVAPFGDSNEFNFGGDAVLVLCLKVSIEDAKTIQSTVSINKHI
jgi:hypothetical protein